MEKNPQENLRAFVEACHDVASRNLVRCSSGNMSLRLDNDRMLVTASRSWMGRITDDEVTLCRISDGKLIQGKKPSIESGFHSGILRSNLRINVVLHFQSPAATTVACMDPGDIDFNVIPEIPYYIGPIARVPFIQPGSEELAAAVIDGMKEHNLVILTNHGLVVVGKDLNQAIQNAAYFEFACDIIVQGNNRVVPMPDSDVHRLQNTGESGAV